ncbi:hypothetical protein Dsin_009455 [Dipteronia sinensis]|uniref:Reverse transcriptase domain-containing protein n=1 Tax=Dipteronia sinensis TaxID=43782 RepID=A0AAE0EDH7_9ROSI|nr:hypothetical protein Dsin_009455 [Dipteronia sinensis]
MTNRLKHVLGGIISETQCAFIPGRLILDNTIVSFECIHRLKRRKRKRGSMAIKLDMAKACDRVEWIFLERMMRKLGFSEKWVRLIMRCVSSVSYSFIINGEVCGNIIPTRGLRQGDLLSPFLFLFCAEGLSNLIQKAQARGDISGFRCSRGGPIITHLFFADDSLIFPKANDRNCLAVKTILDDYEKASGQAVNFWKSAMCISPSFNAREGERKASLIGIKLVECHENYLGLPCFSSRKKRKLFASIVDRVWNRIKGWGEKLLLAGGKEILVKAVIQAIPMYAMSIFRLPKGLIAEIQRLCGRFWDKWIPRPSTFQTISPPNLDVNAKVCLLITPTSGWNLQLHKDNFTTSDVNDIIRIPIGKWDKEDNIMWHYDDKGMYTFNIARRGVQTSSLCDACKIGDETTIHALWDCNKLKYIHKDWTNLHGKHPHRLDNIADVSKWILAFLDDYISANQKNGNKQDPSRNSGGDRWQPLEGGLYKVNCDGLVDKDGGKTGLEVVIRDEEGNVLAFCAQNLVANLSSKAAKLTAVLKSIQFSMDCGLAPCVYEFDQAMVVKWITEGQHNLSENGGLLEDVYSLAANLRCLSFPTPSSFAVLVSRGVHFPIRPIPLSWIRRCKPFRLERRQDGTGCSMRGIDTLVPSCILLGN